MNKLHNIINYVVQNYPYPNELTRLRLIRLLQYINQTSIDAKHQPIINPQYNNYDQLLTILEKHTNISIEKSINTFGIIKFLIVSNEQLTISGLTSDDIAIIDKVINETKDLNWLKFTMKVSESI